MNNKPKIVISCPASSRSGYGNHSRDLIRSLIDLNKFDINIIDQRWGNCPRTELNREENSDLAKLALQGDMKEQPDIWIQVTVPNEFQPVGKYNIGITAGIETDRVSPTWIEGMNRMDMNIVPSQHSARGFTCTYDKMDSRTKQAVETLSSVKPLEVLFEGVDTNVYNKTSDIEKTVSETMSGIKEDFCFLLCGHWMNGDFLHDRKDMGGTIHTFLSTFSPLAERNQPALVIKTGIAFSVPEEVQLKSKINNIKSGFKSEGKKLPSIYIVWGDLTDNEMNSLYNHPKIKAMLSFTHGEGYGRPLAEFSITGKPTIAPGWSGHVDFLNEYGVLLQGEMKEIHKSVEWENVIMKDSQWFYVNYGFASSILKDLHKNYKKYLEKSRKQTKHMKDNFSLNTMTVKFGEILEKYLPSFDVEIPKLEELQTYE